MMASAAPARIVAGRGPRELEWSVHAPGVACRPRAAGVAVARPVLTPRRAQTVPLYAARTGLMCESCHFDPNGGGPRNEFGFGFAKNRHTLAAEDSTSRWKDLTLTNRVGENIPVYFGVNQRFMLLTNQHVQQGSIERLAFFNMENAIHLASSRTTC